MADFVVRVEGLAALNSAFRKLAVEAGKGFKAELMRAAQPVVETAKQKIGRFQGASLGTIKPVSGARSVFVVQDARKVTGLRGDYGTEQMEDLVSALAENEPKVVAELELALERFGAAEGF